MFLSCVLRKRISFMAALFKESAKCLKELPGLFFQPILTFISLILFFAFWVFVILCLATASKYLTEFNQETNLWPRINFLYFIIDYPETKSVQMYKNTIFEPVNLSSIGENAPLIEEKKIEFSLDSFKSNIYTYTCAQVYLIFNEENKIIWVIKYFSFHPRGICWCDLGEIHVVGISYRTDMDIGIYSWMSRHGNIGFCCSLVL